MADTKNDVEQSRLSKMKGRLLKKSHTHAGVDYPKGTPLENLKPSDSTVEFLEKRAIV